jgi:uncharacterized membrane protein YgcG
MRVRELDAGTPLLRSPKAAPARARTRAPGWRRGQAATTLFCRWCGVDEALMGALALAWAACAAFAVWTAVLLAREPAEHAFLASAARVAAVFTAASVPLSLFDMAQHVAHYASRSQRYYLRVLLLPPIYTIESYVALVYPSVHFYMETLRETYECIALLAVFRLACETLGTRADIAAILAEGATAYAARVAGEKDAIVREFRERDDVREHAAAAGWLPCLRARAAAPPVGTSTAVALGDDESGSGGGGGGGGGGSGGTGGSGDTVGDPGGSVHGGGAAHNKPMTRTERFIFSLVDGSAFSCARGAHGPPPDVFGADGHRRVPLIVPFCAFGSWRADASFLARCEWGVAQYVVVRVACSVTTLALEDSALAGDGAWDWSHASLWISLLINFSQLWALWCLVFFAATLWPALWALAPLNKFLLVKIVVFGFWWQSICLAFFGAQGWLDALEVGPATARADFDTAVALQDVLITAEIFVISLLHHVNFGLADFERPELRATLEFNERRAAAGGAAAARARRASSLGGSPRATASSSPASASAAPPAPAPGAGGGGGSEAAAAGGAAAGGAAAAAAALDAEAARPAADDALPSPLLSGKHAVTDMLMLDVIGESASVLATAGSEVAAASGATLRALGGAALGAARSLGMRTPPTSPLK